ncbi:MAG: sterol desaturase family protein [Blastocatellia bacterium]|nr:sterol desaturase family protein [Blastocatellia bacterium]
MIIFFSFLILTLLTLSFRHTRALSLARNAPEWILDGSGLLVQGIAVPALQAGLVYGLFNIFAPAAKAILNVSWPVAFLLNFVLIDYIYYWNHRALHSRALWDTHAVHHTPEVMDVFITSRNTLWTPLLIIYMWANGAFLFLLRDPYPFLLSASITAALDLWRHTSFAPEPGNFIHRAMALLLITPNEHTWHHSNDRAERNFGANLSLWDRLHGTYYSPQSRPERLGIPSPLNLKQKLLFPFRHRRPGLEL